MVFQEVHWAPSPVIASTSRNFNYVTLIIYIIYIYVSVTLWLEAQHSISQARPAVGMIFNGEGRFESGW